MQNIAEHSEDAGAAIAQQQLPDFLWLIDRSYIDLPDEFAPGVQTFYVADEPIIFLLQRGRTQKWEWRYPRRRIPLVGMINEQRLVYNDDDDQYFTLRAFGGWRIFWCAERRLSRTSKHFELLMLGETPLFFRSTRAAELVVQFADQLEDLQWVRV